MENSKVFSNIKFALAVELEKQGSSLLQLEEALAAGKHDAAIDKVAGLLDAGGSALSAAGSVAGGIGNAAQLALAVSLLGGALTGGAAYGVGRHLQNQDKRLSSKKEEISKLQDITSRLKTDYNVG